MATLTENDDVEKIGTNNEELVITEVKPVLADERTAKVEDDESPITGDHTDAEREAIRERRRLEKLERKERREKAISRDKLELDFLRSRNDELERRMTAQEVRVVQQDLGHIDGGIHAAQRDAKMADEVIAKAVAAGNGEDVIKAMRYRDEANLRIKQLAEAKAARQAQPAPQTRPVLDSVVTEHAKDFMEDHPWYDSQGRDEASAVVLAIDNALAKQGLDPKTDDYWDELRKRVKLRLPDKTRAKHQADDSERVARGGPSVGSGREHAPTSTRREVYISPERKQALVDAGVWDDPVLRMKYVKRYAEYDKINRA